MSTPSAPDGVDPTVTAVVISRRDPRGLADLLDAVLDQTLAPDAVVVLDRTGGAVLPGVDGAPDTDLAQVVEAARHSHRVPLTVLPVDPRTPVRAAAHRVLTDHELDGVPTTLAWLLPVGTTPQPDALVALVDTWRRSPSSGVLGPKHLDADDPHVLRALAIRTTRGGRLLSRPAPGEPDQGQYDQTSDALGVPFAGSLVERDLLLYLRGWETSFGDVGADLDLGWRAHNAGRRVVVVPAARMRTEPGVAPAGASTPSRRRAARRVALARSPWWASPALVVWIAVTSVVAALGLLLLKRPRSAWAELSSLASLDPFRGFAARWRTRHRREVSRRDLRTLFEPRRSVLTGWGDAVHDALVSPRPPIGDEANDLNPRSWMAKVVRHPGVLAAAGAALVAAVAGRSLGFGVVTGAGSGLAGGELVGTRADAQVLWHSWTDGWTGAGLGGPDPVGPQAPLLAIPTWLVDHVPLLPDPASAAGFVVALLVVLGMPLAAVSAYLALRPVVATRWVRGLAAFAWATTGVAATSVAQGRLGAVVALVLLPPIACGLWLLAIRRSTATSAFATALAALVLGAFAPVLLALVSVLALVLALRARWGAPARPDRGDRARRRARALGGAPVGGLLAGARRRCGPGPVGRQHAHPVAARPAQPRWRRRTPGVDRPADGRRRRARAPAGARVGLGRDHADPARAGAARARAGGTRHPARHRPGRGRRRRRADHALVRRHAPPVRHGAGAGDRPRARRRRAEPVGDPRGARRSWPGAPRSRSVPWPSSSSAGGVAWATLGTEIVPWQDPRPAVSVDQAEGAFATRALFVSPGARGAGYRFVGREASEVVRPLPAVADADGSVAGRVSAALGDASTGPSLFADTATDLLAVRAGLVPEVTRRLDATEGLQRIAPRDGWEMWRVSPTGVGQDLVAPPRLRLETPDGARLVETTGQNAGTRTTIEAPQGSRLVVAEPLGWAEHAVVTVDGVTVQPVADTGDAHLRHARRHEPTHHHRHRPVALVARRPGAGLPRARLPRRPVRSARVPGGAPMSRLDATGAAAKQVRRRTIGWCAMSRLDATGAAATQERRRTMVVRDEPPRRHGRSPEADAAADQRRRGGPGRARRGRRRGPGPLRDRPTDRHRPRRRHGGAAGAARRHLPRHARRPDLPRARAQRHPRHRRRAGARLAHGSGRPRRAAPGGGPRQRPPHGHLRLDHRAHARRPPGQRHRGRSRVPPARRTSAGSDPVLLTGTGAMAPAVAASQEWWANGKDLRGLVTVPCGAGGSDLWLLAGGSGPGRQERLILTNPGANPVSTQVTVHGTAGQLGDPVVETVAPGGRASLLLDARYGAEDRPAVHVVSDGGGVQATLTDTWVGGSIALGAETTVPAAAPGTVAVVPGVVVDANGSTALRVVVPGDQDAVVKVSVLNRDGLVPLTGETVLSVPAGAVGELPIAGLADGTYTVALRSDVPVVASAFSRIGTGAAPGDFAWSPAATGVSTLGGAAFWSGAGVTRTAHLVSTGGNSTAEVVTVIDGEPRTREVELLADRVATVPLDGATSVWVRRITGSGELRGTIVSSGGTGPARVLSAMPLEESAVTSEVSRAFPLP